jgi:hypothetical protein
VDYYLGKERLMAKTEDQFVTTALTAANEVLAPL